MKNVISRRGQISVMRCFDGQNKSEVFHRCRELERYFFNLCVHLSPHKKTYRNTQQERRDQNETHKKIRSVLNRFDKLWQELIKLRKQNRRSKTTK